MERPKQCFRAATWRWAARLLVALAVAPAVESALALNIVMTFNSSLSVYPSFDPDAGNLKLSVLMNGIETYYEDIFEQSGSLQVNYYYQDLDAEYGSSVLAVCQATNVMAGKVTACRIRVDSTQSDWFLDPTPLDNSEYDLTQKLYKELSGWQKSNWFAGTMPELLEATYSGSANGSEPAASGKLDMYSALLHEMGHGLGMLPDVALNDTADYDYDFAPELVWGNTMAAKCYATDNRYHLFAASLMHAYTYYSQRSLPSAVDIFALQDASEWTTSTIDLKRKDFSSASASASWNTGANWEGGRTPDGQDDAYVRHGRTVALAADSAVASLLVDAASTVDLGDYSLSVTGQATVGKGSQAATLRVSGAAGQLSAAAVVVNPYGVLSLSAGAVVSADTITLGADATLGMELGGLNPGVDSAWIHVTGSAILDGVLEISLADGYVPNRGDVFDLFDFGGGSTGLFDEVVTPDGYPFDVSALGVDGSITFLGQPIAGDANNDGRVDQSDAAVLAEHWGETSGVTWAMGDFNGDGRVDAADASLLAANWGYGAGEAAGVPEPGVMAMLLVGAAMLLARRRQ